MPDQSEDRRTHGRRMAAGRRRDTEPVRDERRNGDRRTVQRRTPLPPRPASAAAHERPRPGIRHCGAPAQPAANPLRESWTGQEPKSTGEE
jgi:hypothetical protein